MLVKKDMEIINVRIDSVEKRIGDLRNIMIVLMGLVICIPLPSFHS